MGNFDVSIIIPCYNARDTIVETVNSALAQEGVSAEVVVVDDGSTDGSRECLRDAGLLGRIVYIPQSNQGVSVARNNGFSASQGAFCCFLDNDDLLEPTFAREMIDALGRSGCRVGYCDYGEFLDTPDRPPLNIHYPTYEGWVQGRIISEQFIPTTGIVLVAREAITDLRFDSGLPYAQDWFFWAQLLFREKLCFHPKVLFQIRFRTTSLSRGKAKMAREVVAVLERIEPLLDTHRSALTTRDIGRFHYRFASALTEIRDFRRAIARWRNAARFGLGVPEHSKLAAKILLEVFGLRNAVELGLWNLRLYRSP
jgi:glycosyltransferase involved in cell wall biosynthesis